MADIEKVISNLKGVYEYLRHFEDTAKMGEWVADAIELLKEQQPLEVVYDINPMTRLPVSFCPKCGEAIQRHEYGRLDMTQLFCSYCGQAIKWD